MSKKRCRLFTTLGVLALLSLLIAFPTTAQTNITLKIEDINNQLFPKVDAYLSASDSQGLPLSGLTKDNFQVTEDGKPINDFTVAQVLNTQQPLAFVIIIDTSGSMGEGLPPYPIDNARNAAKSFIDTLGNQDQVALVSFASQVSVVQGLTTDKAKIYSALDSLSAIGSTALYDAVLQGVTLLKDVPVRKAIILVTDGKDSGKGVTHTSADTATQTAIQYSVPIYPIGFGDIDKKVLDSLAQTTGGIDQISPDSSILKTAFNNISLIFKQQYLLSYTSALPADGKTHELQVALNLQSMQVSDKKQFTAQPGKVTLSLPGFSDGQVVGGSIKFAPEISAPAAIAHLDISIDGGALTSITADPFEYIWDSTSVNVGIHEITLLVTDAVGNMGGMTIKLNVQKPIVITIHTPADGAEIGNTLTVSATVTTLKKSAQIDAILDSLVLNSTTNPALGFTQSTAGITAGSHQLHIAATDAAGNKSESTISLNFRQPVDVQFLNPHDGDKVNGTVTISTTVTSLDPVSSVEYIYDGKSIGSCHALPCAIQWALYNVASGAHKLTANVTNSSGHKGSAEINVTVYSEINKPVGISGGVIIIIVVVLAAILALVVYNLRRRRPTPGTTPAIQSNKTQEASLVELEGLEPNKIWPLASAEVKLGRKRDENDIPLKGMSASRRHAVIRFYQGQYILYNLNPQNTILVNNTPINQQYTLKHGDIFQLGESRFRFDA